MAIDQITTGIIKDDAITAAKIVAGAVDSDIAAGSIDSAQLASNITLQGSYVKLPSITTTQRDALTPAAGMMIYNSTLGLTQQYTSLGWKSIDTAPIVSSISPTTQAGYSADVVVTGTGFVSGFTARFIGTDGTQYTPASTVFTNSTTLTIRTPATGLPASNEPYDIKITNASGLAATLDNILDAGGIPAFTTSAGTLGSLWDATRALPSNLNTAAAVDPDGNAITYAVSVGALPGGLSLNTSTAAITGTATAVGSDTTTNFTISATTANGDVATRAFAITINAPVTTAFTFTGADQAWTAPAFLNRVVVSAWGASGGSDAGPNGFGGAGAYLKGTVTIVGGAAHMVVVGCRGERDAPGDVEQDANYGGGGQGLEDASGGGLSGFFQGSGDIYDSAASSYNPGGAVNALVYYDVDALPAAAAWVSASNSLPNSTWVSARRDLLIAGGGGGADSGDPGGNGGGGATLSGAAGGRSSVAYAGGLGGRADGTLQAGQNAAQQGGGHLKGSDGDKAFANLSGNPRWLGGGGGGYMGGQTIQTLNQSGADCAGGGGSSYFDTTLVASTTTEGAGANAGGSNGTQGSSNRSYGAGDANRSSPYGQSSTSSTGHGNHGRVVLVY